MIHIIMCVGACVDLCVDLFRIEWTCISDTGIIMLSDCGIYFKNEASCFIFTGR